MQTNFVLLSDSSVPPGRMHAEHPSPPPGRFLGLAFAGLALLFAGCAAAPNRLVPAETTKYSIESTGKFAVLDQAAVGCTGLQEHVNPAGRLEVVANVQNRKEQPQPVEVCCVFKDTNGFSTGDVTAWQRVQLGGGATEPVRFTALNSLARQFTVAVRTAR